MKTILKKSLRTAIYAILLYIAYELISFPGMIAMGIATIISELDELNMKM